jgi:hypothetical protein
MSTNKRRQRSGERPGDPRAAIRRIVAGLDCDPSERDRYATFAFELHRAITRTPAPGFEEWAGKVVMKWFQRGLSGYLMRQIGEQLIRAEFPAAEGRR